MKSRRVSLSISVSVFKDTQNKTNDSHNFEMKITQIEVTLRIHQHETKHINLQGFLGQCEPF